MVLDDTMGSSSWLSHFNHPTHREGLTSRGQELLEAREQILAKSMSAGGEAAHRILRQERGAVEIWTCVWDGGNEEERQIERQRERGSWIQFRMSSEARSFNVRTSTQKP